MSELKILPPLWYWAYIPYEDELVNTPPIFDIEFREVWQPEPATPNSQDKSGYVEFPTA